MQHIASERLRQKLLRLCDGEWERLKHLLFHIAELRHAEEVCDWLIARRLTGKRLADWKQEKYGPLFLPFFRYVRAKATNGSMDAPVLVGEDYGRSSSRN